METDALTGRITGTPDTFSRSVVVAQLVARYARQWPRAEARYARM